jgi:dihydrofolate reductase
MMGPYWDSMGDGDPFASVMNTTPKYVVSTTLTNASAWCNSTLIKDDVLEQVRALKAQPGKNILIYGSSVLVHTLAEHDLVDEYSLLVYPLVLGGGKKVFVDGARTNLRLVKTQSFSTGVTLMRYAVERPA